ncbi:MAG: NlpC/P60 family protein [Bacteroidetes bacterium]|nr:NlpC/P60 family protein [Bacteroidota bacterium]
MRRFVLPAAFALAVLAAAPSKAQDYAEVSAYVAATSSMTTSEARVAAAFHRAHDDWAGTRYRYGGMSRSGIDCSALMLIWFRSLYGVNLPRTAAQQATEGERVSRSNLRAGDLVFFSQGTRISHVGVYIGNGQFAHSSSSRGVAITDLSNSYWSPRFRTARRILGVGAETTSPAFEDIDFDSALLDLQSVDLSELAGDEGMDEGMGETADEAPAAPSAPRRW